MKYNLSFVEKHRDLILKAERDLWKIPEVGYKEFKTNAYMLNAFKNLGYTDITLAEGITGFYTVIDTGKEGPTVLVLAELDALYCSSHPECDKTTGAVHACGHHAQMSAMIGLAGALKEKGALTGLCGKIKLCLVPAEEGIDIEYRLNLIKQGVISFMSGKQEFIKRGYFDDVDMAMMVHTTQKFVSPKKYFIKKGGNGVIRKITTIKGKAAHAGANPQKGLNALNAASLAILAINSLRETFTEEDFVRFHSIITKGGDSVNVVPAEVKIESYVRAASDNALRIVNEKINLAIAGAVSANGCSAKITDIPGSSAIVCDENFSALAIEVFENLVGKDGYMDRRHVWEASSTDMGDLSSLMPIIHPYATGATGTAHGKDYYITVPEDACVGSAKFQYAILCELLSDNAKKAKEIIKKYTPIYSTKEEYLKAKDLFNMEKDVVKHNEDGTITLDYKNI
ncbi:MAG: amidohydrolase [Firmicutes bacterium]|nr:amidohydrolase [Candidatus Caballimonas caccae]